MPAFSKEAPDAGADLLSTWNDGPAKRAIVRFVAGVCGADGSEPVPVEERLAVFDNDGTLSCEKLRPTRAPALKGGV